MNFTQINFKISKAYKRVLKIGNDHLQDTLNKFKEKFQEGLIAYDIFSSMVGTIIAGTNSNMQACALFTEITMYIINALDTAGFPPLKNYYTINLEEDKVILVSRLNEDYFFGCYLDIKKTKLDLVTDSAFRKLYSDLNNLLF